MGVLALVASIIPDSSVRRQASSVFYINVVSATKIACSDFERTRSFESAVAYSQQDRHCEERSNLVWVARVHQEITALRSQ